MNNIDWSKAPEGATHYAPAFKGFRALWAKLKDGKFLYHTGEGDWYWGAQPLENETYIERPELWQGTGLPPVGTVCEIHYQNKEWRECEIVAHKQDDGSVLAVAWLDSNTLDQSGGIRFRPIRTQEQIETEERESHVLAMLCHDALGNSRRGLAEALYDAGYRLIKTCDPVGYDD